MRLAGHVTRLGDRRGVVVGKPEAKRLLGRPKRRCEDNIKMNFQEVGRGRGEAWTELIWLRIRAGGGHL